MSIIINIIIIPIYDVPAHHYPSVPGLISTQIVGAQYRSSPTHPRLYNKNMWNKVQEYRMTRTKQQAQYTLHRPESLQFAALFIVSALTAA